MKKLALVLAAFLPLLVACKQEPATVKVMSYNIRYGTADDGDHIWPNRREAAAAMINDQHPLVFGVQEALDFQLEYLQENCPGYKCVGVGREDGVSYGWYGFAASALLVRRWRSCRDQHGDTGRTILHGRHCRYLLHELSAC